MRAHANAVGEGSFKVIMKIASSPCLLVMGLYINNERAYAFRVLIDEARPYDAALTERQLLRAAAEALPEEKL